MVRCPTCQDVVAAMDLAADSKAESVQARLRLFLTALINGVPPSRHRAYLLANSMVHLSSSVSGPILLRRSLAQQIRRIRGLGVVASRPVKRPLLHPAALGVVSDAQIQAHQESRRLPQLLMSQALGEELVLLV